MKVHNVKVLPHDGQQQVQAVQPWTFESRSFSMSFWLAVLGAVVFGILGDAIANAACACWLTPIFVITGIHVLGIIRLSGSTTLTLSPQGIRVDEDHDGYCLCVCPFFHANKSNIWSISDVTWWGGAWGPPSSLALFVNWAPAFACLHIVIGVLIAAGSGPCNPSGIIMGVMLCIAAPVLMVLAFFIAKKVRNYYLRVSLMPPLGPLLEFPMNNTMGVGDIDMSMESDNCNEKNHLQRALAFVQRQRFAQLQFQQDQGKQRTAELDMELPQTIPGIKALKWETKRLEVFQEAMTVTTKKNVWWFPWKDIPLREEKKTIPHNCVTRMTVYRAGAYAAYAVPHFIFAAITIFALIITLAGGGGDDTERRLAAAGPEWENALEPAYAAQPCLSLNLGLGENASCILPNFENWPGPPAVATGVALRRLSEAGARRLNEGCECREAGGSGTSGSGASSESSEEDECAAGDDGDSHDNHQHNHQHNNNHNNQQTNRGSSDGVAVILESIFWFLFFIANGTFYLLDLVYKVNRVTITYSASLSETFRITTSDLLRFEQVFVQVAGRANGAASQEAETRSKGYPQNNMLCHAEVSKDSGPCPCEVLSSFCLGLIPCTGCLGTVVAWVCCFDAALWKCLSLCCLCSRERFTISSHRFFTDSEQSWLSMVNCGGVSNTFFFNSVSRMSGQYAWDCPCCCTGCPTNFCNRPSLIMPGLCPCCPRSILSVENVWQMQGQVATASWCPCLGGSAKSRPFEIGVHQDTWKDVLQDGSPISTSFTHRCNHNYLLVGEPYQVTGKN